MKTYAAEVIDLSVTQAIERYMEMEPNEAFEAISNEWPEQIAALLAEFLYRTACGVCGTTVVPIHIERKNGTSSYISLLCDCDLKPFFTGDT